MFKIVLATKNLNKKREIEEIIRLKDIYPVKSPEVSLGGAAKPLFNGVRFLSLADYPSFPEIEEDGKDFRENAIKKALATANFTQELALADDSGLEVEVLKGEPGIHSARFAGEKKDDRANIKKLLELLKGVPQEKRQAKFRCVIALAKPGRVIKVAEGVCKGFITFEPKGNFGFGYDPVFFLPSYNKTFAELDPQIKNQISHRAKAIEKINQSLQNIKLALRNAK